MAARLDDLLAEADLSPAEYAVLTHVADSLVNDRGVLADWTARHVPDAVTAAVTHEECGAAVASLLARGLLVELTADDVARDLERWKTERVPACVDLGREVGDVDFSPRGAETMRALDARLHPVAPAAAAGYIDDQQGALRVLGATEESCARLARSLIAIPPADLRGASLVPPEVDPVRLVGPWWCSRFERLDRGYEIVIRFAR